MCAGEKINKCEPGKRLLARALAAAVTATNPRLAAQYLPPRFSFWLANMHFMAD